MKKFLIITLLDGRELKRDLTNEVPKDQHNRPRIGVPANDVHYAILCQTICCHGYSDIDVVTETNYTHIAPSQIKSVSVRFERPQMSVN
jgi:hypothetical protein